jgi:hypothetical protein
MTLKNPTTATTAIAITTTEDIPKINDIVFIFYICFFICQRTTTVAEAQGFEPQVPSQVRLISNQIHSTTLSNLLMFYLYQYTTNGFLYQYLIKFFNNLSYRDCLSLVFVCNRNPDRSITRQLVFQVFFYVHIPVLKIYIQEYHIDPERFQSHHRMDLSTLVFLYRGVG